MISFRKISRFHSAGFRDFIPKDFEVSFRRILDFHSERFFHIVYETFQNDFCLLKDTCKAAQTKRLNTIHINKVKRDPAKAEPHFQKKETLKTHRRFENSHVRVAQQQFRTAQADSTRTLIARHRLFSVIFSLFVLAGVSPPASQKEKIPRKFLCGGCEQFSRSGFLA